MPQDPGQSLDSAARINTVLAATMLASVAVYVVIAYLVAPTAAGDPLDPELLRTLAIVLGVVSAATLITAEVLFRARLRGARAATAVSERLAGYRVAMIIAFALRESVAIYGLVLSFLSNDPVWAIGFAAVAALAMVAGWPRRSTLEALAADVPPIG